jgi:hypothetical protein
MVVIENSAGTQMANVTNPITLSLVDGTGLAGTLTVTRKRYSYWQRRILSCREQHYLDL